MKRPITIFYVYAQTDEALRQQLEMHLALLRRQGVLANWQESQAGALWEQEREEGFKEAALILLLISADFVASDVCYEQQMQQALGRERQGEVKVLPILLRPAEMTNAPFIHLPMVPTNAKPVTLWSNQDVAWAHIAEGIRCVLEEKPLPVVQEQKEAARYTTEDLQAMYGPIIGEHNVIHHHYPPVSPPPDTTVSPMKPIWMVPYPRNPFFTGRNEVLDDLHQRFERGQVQAVSQPQAMSGLGGIGKTQIAVEYAYRYRQDYHMVLWVQANMRENLTSSYLSIAELLSLPEKGEQDSIHVIIAIKNWLQHSTGWLLILDNADELILVRDFLPSSFGGHVLLTTRAHATGHFARRLEVGIFPMELGALFLLHRTGLLAQDLALEQASKQERDLARAICEELGGLPLALDQAGAYIEETTCSLLEYQQRYRIHRARLLKRRGGIDPIFEGRGLSAPTEFPPLSHLFALQECIKTESCVLFSLDRIIFFTHHSWRKTREHSVLQERSV